MSRSCRTLTRVATVQVLAAQPASLCPMLEFLMNHSIVHQFFFEETIEPRNGVVALPEGPGMGVEIDDGKVQRRQVLNWGSLVDSDPSPSS